MRLNVRGGSLHMCVYALKRLNVHLRLLQTHLFDKNVVVRVINVEAVLIFDPGVCDVAPVIATASLRCSCSECQ